MQPSLSFLRGTTVAPSFLAGRFLLLSMLLLTTSSLFSQTTWTGTVSTDWNTAGNWSAGLPDADDHVSIPLRTNNPVISMAGAIARSMTISTGGILTIQLAGTLAVDNGAQGISNSGTVQNSGTITTGAASGTSAYGIRNDAVFNNNPGGQINIDRATSYGIYNNAGTFTNQGTITIGATAGTGNYGIQSVATFNNNTGGQINIDRWGNSGIYISNGTFNNQATINIGGLTTGGSYGLQNAATFNNNTGGQINIDRTTLRGIYNTLGTFTTQASINIGATATVGAYGIENTQGTFNNNSGGDIHLDRSFMAGIYHNTTSTFANQGTITIGGVVAITTLMSASTGTFSNGAGGVLAGTGSLPAGNFTNAGGTLAPGYSPGKMTFNASEDFSSSTLSIEVAGTGVAGTNFDQVAVNGTATLGGTLALSITYTPANGDQMTIVSATTLSGTFGSVTGLPANWFVNYTSTAVILSFGAPLPVELTTFSARLLGQTVQLDWRTASEHNNRGFRVERSMDGLRWTDLGFVAGQGTTTEAQQYSFLDAKPLPRLNYYRLRQTDFDGKAAFSKMVSIDLPSRAIGIANLRVFPNPVHSELTVLLPDNTEEATTAQLFGPAGQLLRVMRLQKGANLLDVSGMPAGVYTLQVSDGQGRSFEKIVVQ